MTNLSSSGSQKWGGWLTAVGLLIGVTASVVLAYSEFPRPAFYNQALAFIGFGLFLVGVSVQGVVQTRISRDSVSMALALMLAACFASPFTTGLPWSLALGSGAGLVSALIVLQAAANLSIAAREQVWGLLCTALVIAGLLSAPVALIQLCAPALADGNFIAHTNGEGRAVGNMRQPNNLATLFLWSSVAVIWLLEKGWLARLLRSERRARVAVIVLPSVFALGILFSASRTGIVGLVLLTLWGAIDAVLARRQKAWLQKASRTAMLILPITWVIGWLLVAWWTESQGLGFFTQQKLTAHDAQPSERLRILHDSWVLITAHPWTGTGWGNFNFVWALTPFPDGHPWLVDHSHNLFLQLFAELGLPLGAAVSLLLVMGFAKVARLAVRDRSISGLCGLMLLVLMGSHSMSEYPLWYAYFLLPTALVVGCSLPNPRSVDPYGAQAGESPAKHSTMACGIVMLLASFLAIEEYGDILRIYRPSKDSAELIERLGQGQNSVFFDLHADSAAAQMLPPGPYGLAAAHRAARRFVDVKLMILWATSLNAVGEADKARFLASLIKPTHHPLAEKFFSECDKPKSEAAQWPFQCTAPLQPYSAEQLY